jgi:subtilisin family serine protease
LLALRAFLIAALVTGLGRPVAVWASTPATVLQAGATGTTFETGLRGSSAQGSLTNAASRLALGSSVAGNDGVAGSDRDVLVSQEAKRRHRSEISRVYADISSPDRASIGGAELSVGRVTPNGLGAEANSPSSLSSSSSTRTSSTAAAATHPSAGMRILVRFRAGASDADKADAIHSVGGWIDGEIPAIGVTRIALPGDANDAFGDGPAVAAVLATHPAVAAAELDRTMRLSFDPNDPYYANDPYVNLGEWGIRKAFVNSAWDKVRGSASVTVALLDTGVDAGHPDLQGALVPGTTFVSQPSSGCDPSSTIDDNSHGTHVAGIVGATGNNGAGIAGVAFGVKLMPIKALDCTGLGSLSDVAQAMIYAADHGARIINVSLGSPFDSTTMHSAVLYALQKNVLVVSAAGNCGTSGNTCTSIDQIEYPAAYPEVLAVGATDTDDTVAFFSTQNSTVDVAAPGRRIVSTTPRYATYLSARGATLTYGAFSGTSQASPFVAGLAALLLSGEPQLTPTQLVQRLESTADQLSGAAGTRNDGYGYGRVNGLRAVSAAPAVDRYGATYDTSALPRSVAVGGAFTARVSLTNTSSFSWTVADPNSVKLTWGWTDALGRPLAGLGATVPLAADVLPGATSTLAFPVTAPASPGSYLLRLDLSRAGTPFSTKGVTPASSPAVAGSGIGARYVPTAATSTAGTASFDIGGTSTVSVVLTNTGTTTWSAGGPTPVHLSYHWLQSGSVVTWDGARASLPADVPSGGTVTVPLPVISPALPGSYTLRIDLVQEGVAWFSSLGVIPQDLPANVRSAFTATYAAGPAPFLLPGGRALIPVTVTNIGTSAWSAGGSTPVHLAAHLYDASGFVAVWDGARTSFASDVAPGAQVQTSVIVDAPVSAGAYKVKIDLVREGITWFSALGVATGDLDLGVVKDFRAQLPGGPITVSRANPVAQLTILNTSVATWTTDGQVPLNVAAHWYDATGNVLAWDGPRTHLTGTVAPNGTVAVTAQLGSPPPGAAFVAIDLVSEGVAWFGQGSLRPVTFAP